MGSHPHYSEEAPIHRAMVDGFFIDRMLATDRELRRFVNATGYTTFAEQKPDTKILSERAADMVKAGSLMFTPSGHVVDTCDWITHRGESNEASYVSQRCGCERRRSRLPCRAR